MRFAMTFALLALGVSLFTCGAAAGPPAPATSALSPEAAISRLADRYSRAGTFKLRFEQQYESSSFGAEIQGQGVVTVVADGRLLWEYRKPEGQRGAIAGNVWWMLDPRDKQVIVREGPEATNGPLIRLLSGRIRTLEGFSANQIQDTPTRPTNRVIELLPLAPRDDLERVLVECDRDATTLVRVAVVDTLGNRMTFLFGPPERATVPPASAFELIVPKGYDIVKE